MIRGGEVTKGETRQGRVSGASVQPKRPLRTAVPGRRVRSTAEFDQAPPRATRANAMRLAAEVERLELELAAARTEIATLAARARTGHFRTTLDLVTVCARLAAAPDPD